MPSLPAASREAILEGGEYLVRLESFQGPLDLLLFLIKRAEVDVHDIPIHQIADQYLEHLGQLHRIDIETAGEFLVMAATLVEIKARSLTPASAGEGGDGDGEGGGLLDRLGAADPRLDLVRQLLAYQRFRTSSEALGELLESHRLRQPVRLAVEAAEAEAAPPEEEEEGVELEDAHVLDLFESFRRIIAAVDLDRLGDHRVEVDDTPQALHQADLLDRLERAPGRRISLQDAFAGARRIEMIGLFLAMLELARSERIAIRQESLDGPVEIEAIGPSATADAQPVEATTAATGSAS